MEEHRFAHPVRVSEVRHERTSDELAAEREWDAPLAPDDGLPLRHQERGDPAPSAGSMR
jgi:hypothetical protein